MDIRKSLRKLGKGTLVWKYRMSLLLTMITVCVLLGVSLASGFYIFSSISLISTSATLAIYQFLNTPKFVIPFLALALVIQGLGHEYWMRRVFRFLHLRDEGENIPAGEIPAVIQDILAFPVRGALLASGIWVFSASIFPFLGTYFLHYTRVQAVSIGIALLGAGLAGILFMYYLFKEILSGVLREVALTGKISTRGMSRAYVPIRLKLVVSFMVLLVVGLALLALLESISTIKVLKEQTALWTDSSTGNCRRVGKISESQGRGGELFPG